MTIEEAIKILENPPATFYSNYYPDFPDAIELGIEALREVERARKGDPALDGELLMGETE